MTKTEALYSSVLYNLFQAVKNNKTKTIKVWVYHPCDPNSVESN